MSAKILRTFFADLGTTPFNKWPAASRIAFSLANDGSFKNRLRLHRDHRNALRAARLDRETAAKCREFRMFAAAKVADQDARDREAYAAEVALVLPYAVIPEPIETYDDL